MAPYYVEQTNPLSQLVGLAAAAYRIKNTLDQQRSQNEYQQAQERELAARTAASQVATQLAQRKQKDEEDAALRNRGVDPSTEKPFTMPANLSQVVPNNGGRAATPGQELSHLLALQAYQRSTGQTDAAEDTRQRIAAMQAALRTAQEQGFLAQRDVFNQDEQTRRTLLTVGAEGTRQQNQQSFERSMQAQREQFDMTLRHTPTAYEQWQSSNKTSEAALNAARVAQRENDQWIATSLHSMQTQNDALTARGQAAPNPNMAAFSEGLSRLLDSVSKNPSKADSLMKQVRGLGTLTDSQQAFAIEAIRRVAGTSNALTHAETMQKQSAQHFANGIGGSQAAPPFPGP